MFKKFKKFALQGSVMDLAIGVIIGAAFGKIVTSFVNDILTPLMEGATRCPACTSEITAPAA